MKYFFALALFLQCTFCARSQASNNYLFIEPNVSVNYDSNVFQQGLRYSNSFYEKESYDFYLKSKGKKTRFLVKATQGTGRDFPQEKIDQFMNDRLPMFPKMLGDSLTAIQTDTAVRHIAAFTCSGSSFMGTYEKDRKATIIIANHLSADDGTEVDFLAYDIDNLDQAYKMLGDFLRGFKFYSREKINREDSLIKSMYTIEVKPAKDSSAPFFNPAFSGIAKTKQTLQHQIKEVWLKRDIGDEIFTPAPGDNKVLIRCPDKKKGIVEQKGEFVVLNSFGKRVKIPFSFTYENK